MKTREAAKTLKTALDRQEAGDHYKNMRIQPVEFCQANGLGYCESSVIKYVCRHKRKNGAEDIRKAIHFLELLLDLEYGKFLPTIEDVRAAVCSKKG